MTLHALATALDARGIRLALHLAVDAPVGAIDAELRDALIEHKARLLVHLANEDRWHVLAAERWGPAVGDPEPGIDLPADDWRRRVANLPDADWSAWRRRSVELLPADPTAEQIQVAERRAYQDLTAASPGPAVED